MIYAAILQSGSCFTRKRLSLSQNKKSTLRQHNFKALSNWPHGTEMVIKDNKDSNGALTSTLNWHWKSGSQSCESSVKMESVSCLLRSFLALSADEISKHGGVYKHLVLWSLNRQIFDRPHSMLFIIKTKHSKRLLQIESTTASFIGSPIVLIIQSKTAL